jgi:hypothetical protein
MYPAQSDLKCLPQRQSIELFSAAKLKVSLVVEELTVRVGVCQQWSIPVNDPDTITHTLMVLYDASGCLHLPAPQSPSYISVQSIRAESLPA